MSPRAVGKHESTANVDERMYLVRTEFPLRSPL
jgi:hypothetical protein